MDWRHRAARVVVRLVAARARACLHMLAALARAPLCMVVVARAWLFMVVASARARRGRCAGVQWRLRGQRDT
jgi:hypothetical protein